jgi:hypothetical protein
MTPTWDLFIILFFVIMTVYGFLLGRGRVFNILINSYVGYVVAYELGGFAFQYLSRITEISHSFNVTMFGAKIFVFAFVIFILTLNSELAGMRDDGLTSGLFTIAYGILAAGLILSSVFLFMGDVERMSLFTNSVLASRVYDLRMVWLVGPIVTVLLGNIIGKFGKK